MLEREDRHGQFDRAATRSGMAEATARSSHGHVAQDVADRLRFALVVGAVMLVLGIAKALQVSSLFAGLALGIACRWLEGRSRLTRVEMGGGADVFFIILFVFAGANLHLSDLLHAAPIALGFVFFSSRMIARHSVSMRPAGNIPSGRAIRASAISSSSVARSRARLTFR